MAKNRIPNKQKTPPKKPNDQWRLSDRDKKILIIAAAAIALIVIVWIIVYNAQAVKLDSEGKIITAEGQNWLVYNEKSKASPRYIKLGEVNAAEGYALDKSDFLSDPNEPIYYFKPASEEKPAINYAAMVGKGDYKSIAENTVASVPALLKDAAVGEVTAASLSGKNATYYIYSGGNMNADDPEKIDSYTKQMNAYAEAKNGRCVVLMIDQKSDTGADFLDDQAFIDVLEKALAGLSV